MDHLKTRWKKSEALLNHSNHREGQAAKPNVDLKNTSGYQMCMMLCKIVCVLLVSTFARIYKIQAQLKFNRPHSGMPIHVEPKHYVSPNPHSVAFQR